MNLSRRGSRLAVFLAGLALAASAAFSPADAAHRVARAQAPHAATHVRPLPYAAAPEKDAAIVEDGATGQVLYERNADAIRHPASLTKMMTLYLLFEALDQGKLTLETPLNTSVHASEQAPTKVGLRPGQTIPVETAITALTVLSANDVAVVIAEELGGTEENFGLMMTAKARQLGMTNSNFHNASGLPDPEQLTTARDMALLGRHLAYDFPNYFHYFSAPGFSFKGRSWQTHDNLLGAFEGTDGIKTGYTQASGFNLVSSVVRGSKHVIGVVMGGNTAASRDHEMMRMLGETFDYAQKNPTVLADVVVPWQGGPNFNPFKGKGIGPATNSTALAALETAIPAPDVTISATADATLVAQGDADPTPATAPAIPLNPPGQLPSTLTGTQVAGASMMTGAGTMPPAIEAKPLPPVQPNPAPQVAMNVAPANPVRAPIAQADIGGLSLAANLANSPLVKRWTVQIGAYASEALAKTQLAAYARKALDVFGQAQRMVVAFTTPDGHKLYRARFGVFGEDEARDICKRMAAKGATCFATADSD